MKPARGTFPLPGLLDPDETPIEPSNLVGAPSYLRDHRKRLRERFLHGGADAMPDYELLELILFRAIPRQDVKPLARRLLDHFGSFNAVLSAEPSALTILKGVGDAVVTELKIVEASAHRLAQSKVINQPVIASWTAVIDYCRTAMAHRTTEQFRVLFLNKKNILIADETLGEGTVDHVPVYPREVVRRALELNATALILVHNHPSGDPSPSSADIDVTRQIETAASALGLVLHDHIVIGAASEISFRSDGYL